MPQTDLHTLHTRQLEKLTTFDAGAYPVVSLYLNLQPDDRGRDRYDQFLNTALPARINTYPAGSLERQSLDQDELRIRQYLENVDRSANGLALFTSAGNQLFEAITLAAPLHEHRLSISTEPHLYPLARLLDEHPRYAVIVADTHTARLLVVAAHEVERTQQVDNPKTKRHKMGGWSQARFQRHVDNFREQHAKEVVDALTRTVRDERIASIIIGGDEVIVPRLKAALPKDIAERVVDVLRLDVNAPEHEILARSLDSIRQRDVVTDRTQVEAFFDAYRGSGLAAAGYAAVKRAFELGQVDELLLTATPQTLLTPETVAAQPVQGNGGANGDNGERSAEERAADELIALAQRTAASIRFIQDPELLKSVGGVGAILRFRV